MGDLEESTQLELNGLIRQCIVGQIYYEIAKGLEDAETQVVALILFI